MAKVKIEAIVEHLDHDMKRALEDAVRRVYPDLQVDRNRLYKEFVKAVYRKCNTWETVPDNMVEE